MNIPVLIAGGGPVGMTLARTLSSFGVRCLLVERNPTTTRHPKMDITNGRSMELFRRLGVADKLRAVAVPEENNFDISWITSAAPAASCIASAIPASSRSAPRSAPATTARSRASPPCG